VVLVVAGGYDERVIENVEHHLELVALSQKLNLKVIFLRSISNEERISLLKRTNIMLYTP
jgi:alpha-1,3/alpha-1,6-mannosyltransferase